MLLIVAVLALLVISGGHEQASKDAAINSAPVVLPHSPNSFLNTLHRFSHTCGKKNVVESRKDGFMFLNMSENREWSLKSEAMRVFLGLHPEHTHVPYCNTTQEIIESSKYSLIIEPPYSNHQRLCLIKWFSRESICNVLSRYRNILILGDSLTRHLSSALLMLLSEDFRYGGVLPGVPGFNYTDLHTHCTCDGTYSELDVCRKYLRPVELSPSDINSKYQYCSKYPVSHHVKTNIYIDDSLLDYSEFDFKGKLCGPERTLRLVMIQGGSHYSFAADKHIPVVRQLIDRLVQAVTSCEHNIAGLVRVVFSGVPMVHPAVTAMFPLETDERAVEFYRDMQHFFQVEYPSMTVVMLDFLNLTRDANRRGRSSDGFHQLSDVNMIKVMTLLNVMGSLANSS